jgi:hypothetical protein
VTADLPAAENGDRGGAKKSGSFKRSGRGPPIVLCAPGGGGDGKSSCGGEEWITGSKGDICRAAGIMSGLNVKMGAWCNSADVPGENGNGSCIAGVRGSKCVPGSVAGVGGTSVSSRPCNRV